MALFDKDNEAQTDGPAVDMSELWDAMAVLNDQKPTHKHKEVPASVLNPYAEEKRKREEAAAAAAAQLWRQRKTQRAKKRSPAEERLQAEAASAAIAEFKAAIDDVLSNDVRDSSSAKDHFRDAVNIADRLLPENRPAVEEGFAKGLKAALAVAEDDAAGGYSTLITYPLDLAERIAKKLPSEKSQSLMDDGFIKIYNTAIKAAEDDAPERSLLIAKRAKRALSREKRKTLRNPDLKKIFNSQRPRKMPNNMKARVIATLQAVSGVSPGR